MLSPTLGLYRTLFVALLCITAVSVSHPSHAIPTKAEYGTIINLSGKQRMLTQKMSKEAFLIALSVNTDTNKQSLQNTAALFEKTLQGLKAGGCLQRKTPLFCSN